MVESYQLMSSDEKERVISQYNRQRAKSRRKTNLDEVVESKVQSVEIEPLVNEPEPRVRRERKSRSRPPERPVPSSASGAAGIAYDHPILKRKRVKRDLNQVVFGPTQ